MTLNAITFEPGSAKLRRESRDELRNLGIALNQVVKDGPKLLIEGHTDKKGTAAYNMELSKRRAEAVKDNLVREMGFRPTGWRRSAKVSPSRPISEIQPLRRIGGSSSSISGLLDRIVGCVHRLGKSAGVAGETL